jgi:hypothetical protein
MEISTYFTFKNWLTDLQLLNSMSEKARLAISAISYLNISPTQLNLPLTALAI